MGYSPWGHPESDMTEVTEHPKRKKIHLVMRTLGTCSFNKFPIYHMAVLTASVMVYLASLITGGFVPFDYLPSISPLLPLGGVAQGQSI